MVAIDRFVGWFSRFWAFWCSTRFGYSKTVLFGFCPIYILVPYFYLYAQSRKFLLVCLQLDWISSRSTQKIICQQTVSVRAATIPRPLLESSLWGEFRSSGIDHFLAFYYLKQLIIGSQQKGTRQIWVRFVKYSSFNVSGPSEMPRFTGKLIF